MPTAVRRTQRFGWVVLAAVLSLAPSASAVRAEPPKARPVDYNRDIRPILSDNCFACHGPDKSHRKAGLRLDVREDAIKHGGLEPGKPDKSDVIARILSADKGEVMPPPEANKTLTAAQKDLLKRWVAEGAVYAPHWAYVPLARPEVPAVKGAASPIDAFLLRELAAKGIAPSKPADRRTLLRRASLDLIGLPPTEAEVAAFLADPAPDAEAFGRQVDRLLASPHFGERMAAPWLDAVRYADTVGFHGDQNQNAWAYRDWVIAAFNANKRFDAFTREQIAGDLLPGAGPAERTATCFNRLNMMTREGGAQAKEYLAKYAADRVRTVGTAWLGSTLGCCECHDHKYDPFSARDFYSMAAFFADVKQWGVYADYGYNSEPGLRGMNNDSPFPPEITVESPALRRRIERARSRTSEAVAAAAARSESDTALKTEYDRWRAEAPAFLKAHPDGWATPKPTVRTSAVPPKNPPAKPEKPEKADPKAKPATPATPAVPEPSVAEDGAVGFPGKAATDDRLELTLSAGWLAAVRLELLPSHEHGGKVGRGGGDASVKLSATLTAKGKKPGNVTFRAAEADRHSPKYRGGAEIIGVREGWKADATAADRPQTAVWVLETPARVGDGDTLTVSLSGDTAARVRVSVSPLVPEDLRDARSNHSAALAAALDRADDALTRVALYGAFVRSTGKDAATLAAIRAADAEAATCRGGRTPVMVVESVPPMTVRVLPRGNWQDESGPVVTPAVPHFLPQPKAAAGGRLNRRDLAEWLVSRENPLTARVFVNRLWRQLFGNGLSAQVDDLGAQGEPPSHPDLLDWLAAEFRDGDAAGKAGPWNVKHVVRLMVMSEAYRRDSSQRPELREIDPANRLLAAQNPRRLEAEFVRDNALAVAGLINLEIGGPPCKPYQPPGYYANLQFPDRDYVPETDGCQYRRGVYMHWQRTFLHPMLANFDAPSREDCQAARTCANTPQQALTLLNDPVFVEAARAFAGSLMATPGDEARLSAAFRRALAREPRAKERASQLAFLSKVREECKARPEDVAKLLKVGAAPNPAGADPVELAAWTHVCRVILNLHETITRY